MCRALAWDQAVGIWMLTTGPTSDPVNRARFCPTAWFGFQNKSSLITWIQVEPKIPPRGFSVWNFNTQMSLTLISQNESFSVSTELRYLFKISHSYRLSVLAMNKEETSHYLRWFENNNEYNSTLKITTCLSSFGGFPGRAVVKNPPANAGDPTHGFDPWVGKILWRRKWQPTPVFLPGKSHGQRMLAGYNPWSHKESDTTKHWLYTHNQQGPIV